MNKTLDSFFAFIASIISGLFVAIVGNKIYINDKTWIEVISTLGWWNLLFVMWLLIMVVIFVRNRNEKNQYIIKSEHLKAEQTNALVQLTIESIMYPSKNEPINVHIYFKDMVKKKIVLRKDRRFKYEQEDFPENDTFDYAIVDEDNLIICDSFKTETVIYKELNIDHYKEYKGRLKGKIGKNIKWVLSCPLHNPIGESFGVVCCFGTIVPFNSENNKNYFISLIQKMNIAIVRLLLFERGREFNFIN